ncbi:MULTISPECIES: hypothetical protein [unclassified Clostridium]|uniref:hypothetical protein n=1 Tax=unclassified Clostridium TaxID=2614128 RepID=UPI000297CFC6|nr:MULTISPECIES: hypothetical protein [unclassified Clostridium]EKQ52683.1 MAG: hypothetical protein A370_04104 [Clostridium sp. Maddingley MBC34-26]
MEIIIENTSLFDEKLDNKIFHKLKDIVQELDKSKKYKMDLEFCENLIWYEFEIDSYEIPEEALPPYQRGKVLKGKEKMYALLDYRVDSAKNIVKEYGIKLGSCNIEGTPFMELNKIKLSFDEEEVTQLDNSYKQKKEKEITVDMIMPSFSAFIENLKKASEYIEQKRETELENVFDDKKEYDKYKSLVSKDELYNILIEFKKIYGDKWMYSREYKLELKEKFIQTLEIKAGIICDDKLKESILKPIELKTVLIYEIPVYKMTKKKSGINKSIGHVRLLTNGKTISVNLQTNSKLYTIPNEIFEQCFVNVTSKDGNRELLKIVEDLINKLDENCQRFGYKLEIEMIYNILVYMDIKNILKKAREA